MLEQLFKNKDSTQYRIRILLMGIKADKSISTDNMALEIGISSVTLHRFLRKEIDVRMMTLAKIMQYITFETQGAIS